jgi:hypothetical protein
MLARVPEDCRSVVSDELASLFSVQKEYPSLHLDNRLMLNI